MTVASGCDAAPVLEAAEDALDHIAPSIGAPHPEPAARAVGIMGRVGEQPSCGGARVPQRNGDVGDIARGQRDGDRSAPVIGRAADLRGPPALRPADGFLPRLLLEPAAARCAFTWVLSMERSSRIAPAAAAFSSGWRQTPRGPAVEAVADGGGRVIDAVDAGASARGVGLPASPLRDLCEGPFGRPGRWLSSIFPAIFGRLKAFVPVGPRGVVPSAAFIA